jgi:hypothetical protein
MKSLNQYFFVTLLTLLLNLPVYAQIQGQSIKQTDKAGVSDQTFLGKTHRDVSKKGLPYFLERYIVTGGNVPAFQLENKSFRPLTEKELTEIIEFKEFIPSDFQVISFIGKSRFDIISYQKIIPIRLNNQTNKYEYLESYTPLWNAAPPQSRLPGNITMPSKKSFVNSSVLASGKWFKIGVTKEGVFKMDKAFLTTLGIDINTLDPRNIRVYGNGGKLMSEKNSDFKYDDLRENAIYVSGENDGVFNDADYVLFYGQSTDTWKHQPGSDIPFDHQMHYFSDTSFYFINVDMGAGKRVQNRASLTVTPTHTTHTQDYFGYHELNTENVVKSGREFYGEKFDLNASYSFAFNIPDAVTNDSVYVKATLLSRYGGPSSSVYNVSFNGNSFSLQCQKTDVNYYLADVGYDSTKAGSGILGSSLLSVTVTKQTAQATGWLDKIIYNCRRNITFNQSQFNYRDLRVAAGPGTFAKYSVTNSSTKTAVIWDVTDPGNITDQNYSSSGTSLEYITVSDSLREYCIFTNDMAYTPVAYGSVQNQNLHGLLQADFLIVTHPLFVEEAQRIAKVHQQYDTLTYAIATTEQVYNEFSSGTPDIGGIREFIKMLYHRPADPEKATKYVLLLGDGSYKNKEINVPGNTALIPTYETPASASFVNSYVSDDYFAMMDDTEGDLASNDIVDIGMGRIPVKNKAEAMAVTSKIENYYKLNYSFNVNAIESSCVTAENDYPQGDWRNWVCFVADDENGIEHVSGANTLANIVSNGQKQYNIDKIYLDAYVQTSTPGGDRYPDAVNDLNRRVEKGALIINYTGHGGELGLAEERVVEVSQILNWKNKNNLPLMVTATCEFGRYDDPDRTSAGEYCLFNENGGAISLMTTVRVAYSNSNLWLNTAFYSHALVPMSNGYMPHIGDLYRLTKTDIGFSPVYMNFAILGDPALRLAYPNEKVFTSTINSHPLSSTSGDTLKSLSKISVTGYVGDKNGAKLGNFNGVIYPTVFDKEVVTTTLANDPAPQVQNGSYPYTFSVQKNIIYKGKSQVVNGEFSFSFLVPKDISYNFGKGKISYYAHNGVDDASGYCDQVVIGGSNPNPVVDNQGPAVGLFMNDEKFVSGGVTSESPKIYAVISDSSGINTIGTGIGHDVVAILDENTSKPIVLNDYYVSDLNTYQKGKIRYPFNELDEGNHHLSLKLWDVQNNSTTVYTDFVVAKQAELALTHILNYPNPFTTKTKFFIEHNQCCTSLKVLIQVYTITGKVVKSINQTILSEGYRFDGIEWDGKDDFGDKLARGVYIYRVSVSDGQKKKADKMEKLVILN